MHIRTRFTFLEGTVPENPESGLGDARMTRCLSEPSSFKPTYVEKAPHAFRHPSPTSHSPAEDGGVWPSVGSMGHPHLCSRPCVRLHRGFCAQGHDCSFCHLAHGPEHKLRPQDRRALQALTVLDLLRVTWRPLETLGRRANSDFDVKPIFNILAVELDFARSYRAIDPGMPSNTLIPILGGQGAPFLILGY